MRVGAYTTTESLTETAHNAVADTLIDKKLTDPNDLRLFYRELTSRQCSPIFHCHMEHTFIIGYDKLLLEAAANI